MVQSGDVALVVRELARTHNADINTRGKCRTGCLPLHCAVSLPVDEPAMFETLLAAGADVTLRTKTGTSVLQMLLLLSGRVAWLAALIPRLPVPLPPLHAAIASRAIAVASGGADGPNTACAAIAAAAGDDAALSAVTEGDGMTAAHLAAALGEAEALVALLRLKPSLLEAEDNHGRTPVYYGVAGLQVGIVRDLIAMGASARVTTRESRVTALHALARYHDHSPIAGEVRAPWQEAPGWEIVTLPSSPPPPARPFPSPQLVDMLVAAGAQVDALDSDGATPLGDCALRMAPSLKRNMRLRLRRVLAAEEGAESDATAAAGLVNLSAGAGGVAALHEVDDNPACVTRRLLAHGADVNLFMQTPVGSSGTEGRTALHVAAESNSFVVAQLLLAHGADVHARTQVNLYTPLHCASALGNLALVAELLRHGADVNARTAAMFFGTCAGGTPADFACQGMSRSRATPDEVYLLRTHIVALLQAGSGPTIVIGRGARGGAVGAGITTVAVRESPGQLPPRLRHPRPPLHAWLCTAPRMPPATRLCEVQWVGGGGWRRGEVCGSLRLLQTSLRAKPKAIALMGPLQQHPATARRITPQALSCGPAPPPHPPLFR